MRYRRIAGTDIDVSEVGFGVWTVAAGWWGAFSDDEAAALMQEALDLGVTFFDTAETYGNGRGETVLAHAFPGAARDKIVIGAKLGYDWQRRAADRQAGHQEAQHCWDPAFLENALRGSLRRLGTDRIDHWQLHNPRMDALLPRRPLDLPRQGAARGTRALHRRGAGAGHRLAGGGANSRWRSARSTACR